MLPITQTITKLQARRFMLAYHYLLPAAQLSGKEGILTYFRQVGSIQFDPVEAVGRNPHLVLQARVNGYKPALLDELLYQDRLLVDGWDKVACILPVADWPYFNRYRDRVRKDLVYPGGRLPEGILERVLAAIAERGPLSSLDLDNLGKINWHWGVTVRLERAALDTLYAMGAVGVQRRSGSRRYYDLIERLVPAEVLAAPDPHPDFQDHQDWHVLRRVGSLGLASTASGEHWGGIHALESKGRNEILQRLVEQGKIIPVEIEGIRSRQFYLPAPARALLEQVRSDELPSPTRAIFLGPLDNLLWDRDLLRQVFDFDYVWEVYKPPALRKYGYYTLPILAGDRFVARFSPSFEKKTRTLRISGWWWEESVQPDPALIQALQTGLQDFMTYLGAARLDISADFPEKSDLSIISTREA